MKCEATFDCCYRNSQGHCVVFAEDKCPHHKEGQGAKVLTKAVKDGFRILKESGVADRIRNEE